MNKAIEIAEYVIKKYNKMKIEITNLRLQLLLFLLQKEFIKKNGKELFSDEISAWSYGPIVEFLSMILSVNSKIMIIINFMNCQNYQTEHGKTQEKEKAILKNMIY